MSEKNFNQDDLKCPHCDETLNTVDTQTHRWSPSGGLVTRKGPRVCAKCLQTVDLAIAVGRLQVKQKKAEIERLQEEIGAAEVNANGQDTSGDVWGGIHADVSDAKDDDV